MIELNRYSLDYDLKQADLVDKINEIVRWINDVDNAGEKAAAAVDWLAKEYTDLCIDYRKLSKENLALKEAEQKAVNAYESLMASIHSEMIAQTQDNKEGNALEWIKKQYQDCID